MAEQKELQVKDKQALDGGAEQTRPGPAFVPDVDIFENDNEIRMFVDMPGVAPQALSIDLRDDTLTLSGDVAPQGAPEETALVTEFAVGRFHRRFTLAETIDQGRIEATLADGVLDLVLPKHAKASPRKIAVTSA